MGYRILQKDDGSYAVWGDTVDRIIMDDVDEHTVRVWWLGNAIIDELDEIDERIDRAEEGRHYTTGGPTSYEEAVELEEELGS